MESVLDSSVSRTSAAAERPPRRRGQSGALLLADGAEAFAARIRSVRQAQRSLDVQTYIWRDDATGRFIAHELICAADRGVHVRVLLDDMDARPRDRALAALNQHPQIKVRMFNPFRTRSGILRTIAEVAQRGDRLNHRMHNKSWIADDALAIVGGRNIGDEYFAAADQVNFIDMDVLLMGPAVQQAAAAFQEYWDSPLSVPISRLGKYTHKHVLPHALRQRLHRRVAAAPMPAYLARMLNDANIEDEQAPPLVWTADIRVVADHPSKALRDPTGESSRVLDSLVRGVQSASSEVLLISPYFVPGVGGTAALRRLALQGAHVAVLTNSLAATDVAIVHSGYARYRKPMLQGGVKIFEMKSATSDDDRSRMHLGSSRASLHTKAAIIDGELLFVGSFNIDPRSADLNCEMGVWMRSRRLARQLKESFAFGTDPRRSFEVTLNEQGALQWCDIENGTSVTHTRDPHAGWARRWLTKILGLLPIESQL